MIAGFPPRLPRWSRLAAALTLLGVSSTLGGRAWLRRHLALVTGREGIQVGSCTHCHGRVHLPLTADRQPFSGYVTPSGLAVSPDGRRLLVAAEGSRQLLDVDLATRTVTRQVALGSRPHGVAFAADGRSIAVSDRDGDRAWIFDGDTLELRGSVSTGFEPLGLALSADGSEVYVANGASDDVTLARTRPGEPPSRRLAAGHEPYAVALSRDGSLLAVANRLAFVARPQEVPASELTFLDPGRGRVRDRRLLPSGHLSEGVAVAADASFALASLIRVRNLLPITEVERGTVMTSAVVLAETAPGGRTVALPLDEVNGYYADPAGVAITPDDRRAFVAAGGARSVTAVDLVAARQLVRDSSPAQLAALEDDLAAHARYVLARIPTRDNPRALAMSPDGSRLYVAERLADSIAVIDTAKLVVIERIDLDGPDYLTVERRGEIAFTDASITFQGQFSCRSCHPDAGSDGLSYDFVIDGVGLNRVENRSLRGIAGTEPFKWNGQNPDLETQCGPRFARVLTRSDPFPRRELTALTAYLRSVPLPARRRSPELEQAIDRGRAIFERERDSQGRELAMAGRCTTCHRPPLFTDRLNADVGSRGAGDSRGDFDTPHLLDVRNTAPYLHDGRARTLEEIWTVFNPKDTHGATNDLSKLQLNDLVTYLRSL